MAGVVSGLGGRYIPAVVVRVVVVLLWKEKSGLVGGCGAGEGVVHMWSRLAAGVDSIGL